MPWAIFNRPSIQLSTLQGYLRKNLQNVTVETHHPYLDVAKHIGTAAYQILSEDIWAGEALYSALLFPEQREQARDVFSSSLGSKALRKLPDFDALTSGLDQQLDAWLARLNPPSSSLIGFSVCFGQLPASLLAARRLKKRFPALAIVLGGSTCTPDIAAALPRVFPEIDFILSGEGEQPLLNLYRFLAGQGADQGIENIQRSTSTATGPGADPGSPAELSSLDSLPVPDYDDYFRELQASGLNFIPALPVEFSRGCWWNKCAFCNLNLQWCGYRRKTSTRMISEVEQLQHRYQCLDFFFTDNSLPPVEAERFFSATRAAKSDLRFFAEIRPLKTPETYTLFQQGGLTAAQIGIEALSDSLLQRMNKGSSVMDNVAAMKSCAQAGIRLDGNLILEFPTSTPAEVEETLHNLEFILPFRPLQAAGFFLGQGSAVWKNPRDYGIRNIVPHPYNRKLYPKDILSRVSLLICSGQGDQAYQRKIWRPVRKKMAAWAKFHTMRAEKPAALAYRDGGDFIIIRQELPAQPVLHHRLKGLSRRIYLACDQPVPRKDLLRRFKSVTEKQLDAFLADLKKNGCSSGTGRNAWPLRSAHQANKTQRASKKNKPHPHSVRCIERPPRSLTQNNSRFIMSEERFEDIFNAKNISTPKLKPGDRIDAVIAGISGENVFLDVGGKSEGVMAAAELRNPEGEINAKPGDTVSVFLLASRRGELVFTTRLGSGNASLLELEEAFLSGIPVEGRVVSETKGGFEVTVAGQRAFCPYSQMDIRRIEDPAEYLEQSFQFKIIEFGSHGRNIILSARAVLEEEREQQLAALKESLHEGDRVHGTVTSLREFGAFVDIGGMDGLIPISELTWGQVDRVEDILTRGQDVEVVVRKIEWDRDRISLSLKETSENPWTRVTKKYPPGSIQQGTVSRLAQFGAFVTLEPGVDGLVHISKLGAGRKINHPREVLEPGREITVRIESVDSDKQRISLVPEDYVDDGVPENAREVQTVLHEKPKSLGTLGDLLAAKINEKKSGN